MKIFLCCLFLSLNSMAVIFGEDDRVEYFDMPQEIQKLSASSAALVWKDKLKKLPNGDYLAKYKPLSKIYKMCPDARFREQEIIANCSGALIAEDILLTAAHCVQGTDIENYVVVFGYKKDYPDINEKIIKAENVYTFDKVHYNVFEHTNMIDLAIISLNKKTNRPFLKVNLKPLELGDSLHILGYPLGTPLKWTGYEAVKEISSKYNQIKHDLDIFSVNSGSPTLNMNNEIVGVLVRGTGANISEDKKRKCYDWTLGTTEDDYSDSNHLQPLKAILEKLKIDFIE